MSKVDVIIEEEPENAPTQHSFLTTCPSCGAKLPHTSNPLGGDAQQKIEELEAQIKILTLRATSAVERATDFEDALRAFKSAAPPQILTTYVPSPQSPKSSRPSITRSTTTYPTSNPTPPSPTNTTTPSNTRLSRLLPIRRPSLLPTRRATSHPPSSAPLNPSSDANPSTPSSTYTYPQTARLPPALQSSGLPPTTPNEADLLAALTRETTLRKKAESHLERTNDEIEELTGTLFTQANEMVADERRERAKAEKKIAEAEARIMAEEEGKRVLEGRVRELEMREEGWRKEREIRSGRLEVLEGRVRRVERVRGLLAGRSEGGG